MIFSTKRVNAKSDLQSCFAPDVILFGSDSMSKENSRQYSVFEMTSVDSFFLTVVSAWISVRLTEWLKGNKNFLDHMPFFILLVGILSAIVIISTVRKCLYCKENNQKDAQKGYKLYNLGAVIFLVVVIIYFFNYHSFLSETDFCVIFGLAFLWLIFACGEIYGQRLLNVSIVKSNGK